MIPTFCDRPHSPQHLHCGTNHDAREVFYKRSGSKKDFENTETLFKIPRNRGF